MTLKLTLSIVLGLCGYVFLLLLWRTVKYLHAKRVLDNIPGPPRDSVWIGNFGQFFNPNGWAFHKDITEKYGSVIKIHGVLGDKQLYIYDPKALHHIVVKDQEIYEETELFTEGNMLIFGPSFLSTHGERHKRQRKMLGPVFSIAHMRQMVPIFYGVAHKMQESLKSSLAGGPREVDMLRWMGRAAVEMIGQGGLGYSFDTLTDDTPDHPYILTMKQLQPVLFKLILPRQFLPWLSKRTSPGFRRALLNITPWPTLHKARDMADFMHETSLQILEEKKRALEQGDAALEKQVAQGKDILSILLRANMNATNEDDRLPDDELLAHISTLIFAAMDTTSVALSRVLDLLSQHSDIQTRLRQELVEARKASGGSDLSYDALVSLPYLDAVCRETLRLYPPLSYLLRTARKDVVLPLSSPITGVDGKELTDVTIPENTNIVIGIMACNRNAAIWGPDVLEWKPERWLSPLPETLVSSRVPGIYSHLMTFLGGGRSCIGFKFSQLEMKAVLSILVESFVFSLPKGEIIWNMTAIATPGVKGDSSMMPRMPLKLELVES